MGKESQVEIPEGSGNFYRYEYDDGKTVYKGPVGDAPGINEQEFFDLYMQPDMSRLAGYLKAGTDVFIVYGTGKPGNKQRREIMRLIGDMAEERNRELTSIDPYEEYDTIIGRPMAKDGNVEWEHGALTNAYRYGQVVIIDDYVTMDPHIQDIIRGIVKGEEFYVNGESMRRHPGFQLVCTTKANRLFPEDLGAFPEVFNMRELE